MAALAQLPATEKHEFLPLARQTALLFSNSHMERDHEPRAPYPGHFNFAARWTSELSSVNQGDVTVDVSRPRVAVSVPQLMS
jgi:hypothetical protein